ncbi:MAG: hypothetical protein JWM58_2226 [Rhizobium sp.]|nr:hypothetical protein [Rhizobium sp.]
MLNTNEKNDEAPDVQVQYQTDQSFQPDGRHSGGSVISSRREDPVTHFGDISLAMRQFYQSPVRQAG